MNTVLNENKIPRVSVVIPAHNQEKYIAQCLDSLIHQTMGDFEAICVFDGSKDNTLKILKEYEKKDFRIKIAYTDLCKPGVARNFGVRQTKGEFLLFLDGDDYLENNALELLSNKIEKENVDVVAFDAIAFYEEVGIKYLIPFAKPYYEKFKTNPFSPKQAKDVLFDISGMPFKFYRTKFWKEKKIEYSKNQFVEDALPMFQAFIKAKTVSALDVPVVNYRKHSNNSSAKKNFSKNLKDIFDVFYLCEKELKKQENHEIYLKSFFNNRFESLSYWYKQTPCLNKSYFVLEMKKIVKFIKNNYDEKYYRDNYKFGYFEFITKFPPYVGDFLYKLKVFKIFLEAYK